MIQDAKYKILRTMHLKRKGSKMKELELLLLLQELLKKITDQRERFGNIDSELLYQYDRLSEYIDNL